MKEYSVETYFDIRQCEHAELFNGVERVWEALGNLDNFLKILLASYTKDSRIKGEVMEGASLLGNDIVIEDDAVVEPGACIIGPAFVGRGARIRHGAYLHDGCLLSEGVVVGNASEIKHSIMLVGSKAPHFAYVGDSILGSEVNLGAGTKLANLEFATPGSNRKSNSVVISINKTPIDTGIRKLGAIIGDNASLGCNCVTNPGTLLGAGSVVYPCVVVNKGFYAPGTIIALRQVQEILLKSSTPN